MSQHFGQTNAVSQGISKFTTQYFNVIEIINLQMTLPKKILSYLNIVTCIAFIKTFQRETKMLICSPRRCSSVSRLSFKGPSLVQLYRCGETKILAVPSVAEHCLGRSSEKS